MIKATKIELNPQTLKATVSLFADTKAEVSSMTTDSIIGFPAGYELDFGSSIITSSGDLALLKSDGTWNWPQ